VSAAALAPARLALLLLLLPAAGSALERLSLAASGVSGSGWSSGPLTVTVARSPDGGVELEVRADALSLPPPLAGIRSASLRCRDGRWTAAAIACPRARLALEAPGAAPLALEARVSFEPGSGRLRVTAPEQPFAGGRLRLRVDADRAALRAEADLSALPLATLADALAGGVPRPIAIGAGTVAGTLRLEQGAGSGTTLSARLRLRGLAFSDARGLHAGEDLAAHLELEAALRNGTWRLQAALRVDEGAAYLHPLLLDVGGEPVTGELRAGIDARGEVRIERARLRDPLGATFTASAHLAAPGAGGRLRALSLALAPAPAARLYARYGQPFTGAGPLSELLLEGQVSARLRIEPGGGAQASLALDSVDVGDARGRFAVLDLDGAVRWSDREPGPESRLRWRAAQAWSLDLGSGRIALRLEGRRARLLEPLRLALLDGALVLERLQATGLGGAAARVEADARLEPLSLERLSERLAWLPLSGSVAGSASRVVYQDQRLTVDDALRMRLFDGRVTISSLTLEQPFGVVPRLRADLSFDGIDLGVLTRALSFGSIEGRLDGRVHGLVLEAWQPVAFDAVLATPEDDPSRHRISQRAVDNLASLGGAGSVLSSTFLRFFEEFSYERLGLRCRLRAGVCEMGGVEPAERGYYIVKGGGLPPRVDVVGFNRRVDWSTLLSRLRAVAASSGPVIR